MRQLREPNLYKPVHMLGKELPVDILVRSGAVTWRVSKLAGSLNTEKGSIFKGDLLEFAGPCFGFALGFALTYDGDYLVFAEMLVPHGAHGGLLKRGGGVAVRAISSVTGSTAWVEAHGFIAAMHHLPCR